jgi:hypothetical protein
MMKIIADSPVGKDFIAVIKSLHSAHPRLHRPTAEPPCAHACESFDPDARTPTRTLSHIHTRTHKQTHPPRRPPALTARWQAWTAKGMDVTSRLRELTAVFLFAGAHCDARSDWLRAMRLRSALVHRRRPIVRCAAGVGGTSELVHPLPPRPWPCGPPSPCPPVENALVPHTQSEGSERGLAAHAIVANPAWPRSRKSLSRARAHMYV